MSEETTEVPLLIERRGAIMLITLNRPEAMNSVNMELAQMMADAMDELDADDELRVGVLTGNGRGFSAGMDLKAFLTGGMPNIGDRGFAGITERSAAKPLIAAVEGFALAGGLEIALSCDIIVGSAGAKFGIPEVGVGLFAGAGGLLRLPQVLPRTKAMQMALTGQPISAEEAYSLGMLAEVTEKGEALGRALELAEVIAGNAPLGVMASKDLIQRGALMSDADFYAAQAPEITRVFGSEDAVEGPSAFAEKRKPNWSGR